MDNVLFIFVFYVSTPFVFKFGLYTVLGMEWALLYKSFCPEGYIKLLGVFFLALGNVFFFFLYKNLIFYVFFFFFFLFFGGGGGGGVGGLYSAFMLLLFWGKIYVIFLKVLEVYSV